REGGRSRIHVSQRYLYDSGQSRGPAGHVGTGRFRGRPAGGDAVDRQLFSGGAAAERRAPFSAGDRLAYAEAAGFRVILGRGRGERQAPGSGGMRQEGTLSRTRREYVPVGSTATSMSPTVRESSPLPALEAKVRSVTRTLFF